MSVLVIAEWQQNHVLASTRCCVAAAQAFNQPITVLLTGQGIHQVATKLARLQGVSQILLCNHPAYAHGLAEPLAQLVVELAPQFTHLIVPANTFGKNLMPRVAALLDLGMISDLIRIIDMDTFVRPIYAGNAMMTVQSLGPIHCLSIRLTAFQPVGDQDSEVPIQSVYPKTIPEPSVQWKALEASPNIRPELTTAKRVVSGGRALGSAEKFALIEQLADVLGAAVGASRAAVDAGFAPNDYQVGQTGKIVAPELYIAVGISGAVQHIAGMKESRVVVAINHDPDAPIFRIATYGLVADLFEAVPELIRAIKG